MNKRQPIYLDHAATTPIDPRVLEAMIPVLKEDYGNASSVHSLGRKARYLVEESRAQIADLIGASSTEVLFTSGGTESNNAALRGISGTRYILVSRAEHESVLQPAARLADEGVTVHTIDVSAAGYVQYGALGAALSPLRGRDGLVCVMHVNNETGALSDVAGLAEIAHEAGALVLIDAVQSAGLFALDVDDLGADLMTLSGHKIYGPKGVGLLYVRAGTAFESLLRGGSQEQDRRAGTENVAGIVGFARALDLAHIERDDRVSRLRTLQGRLLDGIQETIGERCIVNTPAEETRRSPHIVNIAFPPRSGAEVDGEMLLLGLDVEGVCASSGSACTSGTVKPSHVLEAMGRDRSTSRAALRFSIGKDNTELDIDMAIEALTKVSKRVLKTERAGEMR